MIELVFPDNSKKTFKKGVTGYDVAKTISNSLARKAVAVKLNNELIDLNRELVSGSFEIITIDSEEGFHILNHSAAHILAAAVVKLFPEAKPTIGPAIDKGFYYDFFINKSFSENDKLAIESEMKRIINSKLSFERIEMPKTEALTHYKNNKFKTELINELPGSKVSFYKTGDFIDLCRGPHIPNTSFIKAFKLTKQSSAYWRGDESRESLQRIYGIAFNSKSELNDYLNFLEEVKKRNHLRLNKQLDLFGIYDVIGKGLPVFHPNGMIIRLELKKLIREINRRLGFKEVWTPHVAKVDLWKQSGHYDHYKDDMYLFTDKGVEMGVKPMNCPFHIQIYKSKPRSYRDLPIKFSEFATVYRYEKSGELNGLFRVRALTQDDGHIWLLPKDIKRELKAMIEAVVSVYKVFGMNDYVINFSTKPANAIGDDEIWVKAESIIKSVLEELKVNYVIKEGEGAFYGPKIDFDVKDAIGRYWQCGTVQLDFFMPERFNMEFTGEDGAKHRPVMIHRALFGTLDRFTGILIEHFAGEFPSWLAPVQVIVLPVSDKSLDYAKKIESELLTNGFRAEIDSSAESLSKRVREAELMKTPYIIIIGEEEVKTRTISVRPRHRKPVMKVKLSEFIKRLSKEVSERSLKLSY